MDFLASHSGRSNHTFLATHYPSSCTLFSKSSEGKTFSDIAKGISIHLNGHLHTLVFGLGARLFAHHDSGVLELELGDLKGHGKYRLVAVDNDLISFTDLSVGSANQKRFDLDDLDFSGISPDFREKKHPPIVLVTNPKPYRYHIRNREDLGRIGMSKDIRMLIYSSLSIDLIQIYIDGILHPNPTVYSGNGQPWESFEQEYPEYLPIYKSKWDPKLYNDGKAHEIKVVVADSFNQTATVKHSFRLTPVTISSKAQLDHVTPFAHWIIATSFPEIVVYF